MNLNTSNLSHPRIQWEIEAAMWLAIEISRPDSIGITHVKSSSGQILFSVMHDRRDVPAFSFWQRVGCGIPSNITPKIIKALREQAKNVESRHG